MRRPRHPKPDANQALLVGQLRDLGFIVHDVSSLGGDCLDLFVLGEHHHRNQSTHLWEWVQIEIKTESGELTAAERTYMDRVYQRTPCPPLFIARSLEDILHWYGWL